MRLKGLQHCLALVLAANLWFPDCQAIDVVTFSPQQITLFVPEAQRITKVFKDGVELQPDGRLPEYWTPSGFDFIDVKGKRVDKVREIVIQFGISGYCTLHWEPNTWEN